MTPHEAAAAAWEAVADLPPHAQRAALPVLLEHLLGTPAAAPFPATLPAAPVVPNTGVGVAEYLAGLPHVESHPARVVALAYYVHRREARGITGAELRAAYRAALQKAPQNWADVIASCVRRGLLVEAPRRAGLKSWTVTERGERLVEGQG